MLILILASNVISAYCFFIKGTFNTLLKDNVDYKVDLLINEEDYEMIDKTKLKEFNVDKKLFSKFDEIASMEYKAIMKTNDMNLDEKRETSTLPIMKRRDIEKTVKALPLRKKSKSKKYEFTTHAIKRRENVKEHVLEYNYNELLNEYYEQADNDMLQDTSEIPEYGVMKSLKRIFLLQDEHSNYNKSIGLLALKGLFDDYRNQRRLKIDIACRLWRITQIWFLVYLIFAVPLWCTRGWCCCCLFCKFFKPRKTIEEAKKYLVSNPPGVFKTKNGEVHYDPTEREKETHEEFDHYLKTN